MESKDEFQKSKKNDADALEAVLTHVGDMGRYQKILFATMMPFGVSFAFVYFVQMFIAVTPQRYWCSVPELAHLDMEVRRNLSAPGAASGGEWDKCHTFDVNWTKVLASMEPPPPGTPTITCQQWDFELVDIPYHTVVSERGWVCDNSSNVPTAQALFFLGAFVGGLLFGWLADNFGRVPAVVGTNLIAGIGGILTIYTKHFWDFALARFLVGMAFDNCFMMVYILVLEYVGPRHRTWVGNMAVVMFFGPGCLSLPWIALGLKDWRKLLWVTSLPMLLVVFAPLVLPESARWYVSRGRVNDAVKIFRKFEKVNKTKIPEEVMDEFIIASNRTNQTDESLLMLLKSGPLRLTMIIIVIVFMSIAVIFDGLVRLSDAFGLDFFIAFTLTSATEIPSVTLLVLVLDRWGRRNLTAGPTFIAAVMILAAMFVPKGIGQASLAIMARFCMNMSYNAVIQWATELLPTAVRASGSATLHMSGYVVTVLSPFIVYSEQLWSNLPLLLLGSISLLGSGLSLVLPETNGRPMPQTLADGERMVKEQMICGKVEDAEETEWKNEKEKSLIIT